MDPFSKRGQKLGLDALSVGPHLGGTSFAAEGAPRELSAFYLELTDEIGGLNFGGNGNGQPDLLRQTWSWAC